MSNVEELERALDYPWEKWTVFLHPAQRQLVERDYNGPARVSGSAGTGKTIVALHRGVSSRSGAPIQDARRPCSPRFPIRLVERAPRPSCAPLLANQPRLGERVDVYAIEAIGRRLYGS